MFSEEELIIISDCVLEIIIDIEEQEDILDDTRDYLNDLLGLKRKIHDLIRGEDKEVLH